MPAGDAQRVWFPEIIERLRAEWGDGLSFPSLIELWDTLEIMLRGIRSDRFIRPQSSSALFAEGQLQQPNPESASVP
jgi:hypothetical protein